MNRWTNQEISFLQQNYYTMGVKHCANILHKTPEKVRKKASKLKLKISPKIKSQIQKNNSLQRQPKKKEQYLVNLDLFNKDFTKESSYILGLLWADGYLYNHSIRLEAIREDLEQLYPHFLKTGQWRISYRSRPNRKPQATINTSNKLLLSFLHKHNYGPKNYGGPTILENIPKKLHYLWLRGIIDGDGCWYINKKRYLRQFTLAGHYEQDWKFMEKILQELQIQYSIFRRIQGKNKHSLVRITNKKNLKKLGDYIYQDNPEIGLSRKYSKWQEIMESYRSP